MAIKQLSDGGPDGVGVGQSATDKVGFHGATPVAKATLTLMVTAGETTPADVAAGLLELATVLKTKGVLTF